MISLSSDDVSLIDSWVRADFDFRNKDKDYQSVFISEQILKFFDKKILGEDDERYGCIYIYNGVYYEQFTKDRCFHLFKKFFEMAWPNYVKRVHNEIFYQVRCATIREFGNLYQPEYIIVFKNGLFNTNTKKLFRHDPKYEFLNCLPYNYAEDDPIEYLKAIERNIPDPDDRNKYLSFISYSLTPSIKHKYILVTLGPADCGKTSMNGFHVKLLGDKAGLITTQMLEDEGHYAYKDKTLVWMSEVEGDILPKRVMAMIKQGVNNPILTGRGAYKARVNFKNTQKLLLESNELFELVNYTDTAFMGRFDIIYLDALKEEYRIEGLYDMILENEAEQVLSFLARYESDFEFKIDTNEMISIWKAVGDTALWFVNECCQVGEGSTELTNEVNRAYTCFCESHNKNPLGWETFKDKLKAMGYPPTRLQGNDWVYDDLSLNSKGLEYSEE